MPQPAAPTDEELLELARRGDQRAFGRIVERYEPAVAAVVTGMLGRGAEAEDVGQETFIRLYQRLHQFRGEAHLRTYITRIAINQALKALRRRQSWRARFFAADDALVEALPAPPPPDADQAAWVQQALAHLSPDHRAVVVLRLMEGYSTNETAALLGIPPGTVMSRLTRALARLEPLLESTR